MFEIAVAIGLGTRIGAAAESAGRNKWGYGILGAVIFYAIHLTLSVGILLFYYRDNIMMTGQNFALNVVVSLITIIIAGALTNYLILPQFEKTWEKSIGPHDDTLLDAEFGRRNIKNDGLDKYIND